ncbi:PP2C family protein-serine/threonine phosphatase [Tautonia plasticadhaerens]|uniref:Serine/threonine phosphatase stp n=1 Tax=Tautonia plasticadhaerens TaxID=2527974 RepID=A0A518GWW1_9BACT|nr:protein phosphatase 2C domain-containing protein [Tautonia plasticadhaerens]QDV33080.1 Serine/threonine phosphatase stp [Tautonia plasticadhaerens]
MSTRASRALTDTDEFLPFGRLVDLHYEAEPRQLVRAEFAARTDVGKVREVNEDQYLVVRRRRERDLVCSSVPVELLIDQRQHAYTAAVADGIGGHRFGDLASLLAVRVGWELGANEIKWTIKTNPKEVDDLKQKATIFMQLIHRALKDEARDNPRLHGMGTTLTLCQSVGPSLFVVHVGDSRAYLHRDGTIRRLTRDHTLAQLMIDLGEIDPDSPEVRRVQHVLSNALGVGDGDVFVEFSHHEVADGDRLLLCTDGLSDLVPDAELGRILDAHPRPEDACKVLVDLALARGGRDNITVVVGRYEFEPDAVEP